MVDGKSQRDKIILQKRGGVCRSSDSSIPSLWLLVLQGNLGKILFSGLAGPWQTAGLTQRDIYLLCKRKKRERKKPTFYTQTHGFQALSPSLSLRQSDGLKEEAQCSVSHWGPRRSTEVKRVQTFPSLLPPRGAPLSFHFTNNLRTTVQDVEVEESKCIEASG